MNISKLIEMIKENPKIVENRQSLLDQLNEKNIKQTRQKRIILVDEEVIISFAELNGGPATDSDIDEALKYISKEPLLLEAKERQVKVETGIIDGTITNTEDILSVYSNSMNNESK